MILFSRLILTLALPLLLGLGTVALICKNERQISFLERMALAWGLGIGLLGLEMFGISLLGVGLNLKTILLPNLIIILLVFGYLLFSQVRIFDWTSIKILFRKLGEFKNNENQWIRAAEKLLIMMIFLTITYVFFDALIKPIVNFDALWRQGPIAKIIFTQGRVLTAQALELAGPHPYLNPLSQAWIYIGTGDWNDALGKIVFPLSFTSLLFIFYANLRKSSSQIYALLFTCLLTSFPLVIFHAGTAYSDFMQTFYYSAGIIYLFQWMKDKNQPALYFSALFLGIGTFVKQIGIPLWAVATFGLLIYLFWEDKKEFKSAGVFIFISTLVSAIWLFFPRSFLMLKLGLAPALPQAPQKILYGLPSLTNILSHLGRRIFTYADWQILWFLFLAALLLFARQIWESKIKYLILIIFLDLGMIVYAFFEPQTYQFLVDGTLAERMLMCLIPVTLFCLAEILEKSGFEQFKNTLNSSLRK